MAKNASTIGHIHSVTRKSRPTIRSVKATVCNSKPIDDIYRVMARKTVEARLCNHAVCYLGLSSLLTELKVVYLLIDILDRAVDEDENY